MELLHVFTYWEVVDHFVLLVEALILVGLIWSRASDQTNKLTGHNRAKASKIHQTEHILHREDWLHNHAAQWSDAARAVHVFFNRYFTTSYTAPLPAQQ